jgi:endoglucanase
LDLQERVQERKNRRMKHVSAFVLVLLTIVLRAEESTAHRTAALYRRGVNFGNHLEFASFKEDRYADADYKRVKAAGFDHIRIPIAWHSHTGPGPEFLIEENFFGIVDRMVAHARTAGLRVVINDHHFDALTDDPWSQTNKFCAIWKQVAAHYWNAQDVVFELLNEPKDKATADVMNVIWAQGIEVVRKAAPERTIMIGTARWNNTDTIDALKLPENDRNLIVTVHCYEPFLFTHQGATWAGNDPLTVGIKFPGPPNAPLERNPKATNAWVAKWISDYNTLPAERNPSSPRAFRARMEKVAKWAKDHNRPVYIGEFGAIKNADPKSRAYYDRAMREICEELSLGWAVWDWNAMFEVQSLLPDIGMKAVAN